MKLCLIIPGDSITRIAACRIMEENGFFPGEKKDGVYTYNAGNAEEDMNEDMALDIVIFDHEQSEWRTDILMETLCAMNEKGRSFVLLCNHGSEKETFRELFDEHGHKYTLRPFEIEKVL